MAKRGRIRVTHKNKSDLLTGPIFNDMQVAITTMARRIQINLHPFTFTDDWLLTNLFDSGDMKLLRAAYSAANKTTVDTTTYYDLASYRIAVEWGKARCVPAAKMNDACPGMTTMCSYLDELDGAMAKVAQVRRVVGWLDKNATWGAVQYYFPSMFALLPSLTDVAKLKEAGRYREPAGIAALIPDIREAANTVAMSLLLPTREARNRNMVRVWKTGDHTIHLEAPID